jgi:hypothetical protein
MANTKSNKNLSFAYSYGFTEGKVHSRKLTKQLIKAGYRLETNYADADLIIAHSAGCWYKLDGLKPKLMVFVGMPLPNKNAGAVWLESNKISAKALLKHGRLLKFLKSIVYNVMYLLRHPRRNFDIVRKAQHAMPPRFKDTLTVFVINKHDPWPQSQRLNGLLAAEPWSFIGLDGTHNNLWHEPEKYIKIIDHYAELLAKTDS